MNEFLQSLTCMQKNVDSCENFLVHFRGCDPHALHHTHNDPAWECRKEEAGGGCQQHSTARTLADPKNKSDAKTREGGEKGLLWDREGDMKRDKAGRGKDEQKGKVWTRRYALERERGQRREAWKPDPTPLPMVRSDTEPLGSRSPTALLSNIRHIPLLLTQEPQTELEGHDGIGVKVNLKARDEVH